MPYDINNAAAHGYLKQFLDINTDFRVDSGNEKSEYNALVHHLIRIKERVRAEYAPDIDYQALYTRLHELSDEIGLKSDLSVFDNAPNLKAFHEAFFTKLYANDSKPFEDIHLNIIARQTEAVIGQVQSQNVRVGRALREEGIRKPGFFQFTHPENAMNKFFSGLLGIDYNPLKRTNVPYVAFEGKTGGPDILRMGTQVQGLQTLQKSFLNFLAVKKAKEPDREHHHIYFNLLKRDVGGQSGAFERIWERLRTNTLERINRKNLGATVITLPADSASFFEGYSKKEGKARDPNARFAIGDLQAQLVASIRTDSNDFYIPPDVKQKIFGENAEPIIGELLNRSAKFVMGEPVPANVTAEQRQAILFDFVKSQLSNHIIKQLNPSTVNFSCKDAIDRGGVHTLWYEFKQRLGAGTPMDKDEFNKHLDASALLVKGRAVNDHRNVIWNALSEAYVNNPAQFQHADLAWVKPWLTANFPTTKSIEALKSKQNRTLQEETALGAHNTAFNTYRGRIDGAANRVTAPTNQVPTTVQPTTVEPTVSPPAWTTAFNQKKSSSPGPSEPTSNVVSLSEHRKGNKP